MIFIAISVFMFFASKADAQKQDLQFNLDYNYGIPLAAFNRDLVKDNSPRGVRGSLMYFFNDKLAAGVESGYQDYYQKYPRAVYPLSKSQDVSAVLTNSIQTTPFLLKVKYSPLPVAAVRPYLSLGAGANLINFTQYLGEFGSTASNVGFMAQGELGVMIPFGKISRSGITIGTSYDYAPYHKYGYHNLSSLNIKAGVVFTLH